MLSSFLGRAGQELRRASNRLTTSFIKHDYFKNSGGKFLTLQSVLTGIKPQDFGVRDNTSFIAAPNCEKPVDDFLSGSGQERVAVDVKKFRNGESYARILDTVRNKNVVIFQDFSGGRVNDRVVETLLLVDAAKRADAKQVTLVCPEIPYIDDLPQAASYKFDYFKLMLNLFFKAAGLDEMRIGSSVLNSNRSLLFLQDRVLSRKVAPFMIEWGKQLSPATGEKQIDEPVFLAGRGYRENAQKIIERLRKSGINGKFADFRFTTSEEGRIEINDIPAEADLRGATVYVFQTCNTGKVNDDLMEALLMIYSAKKRGAKEIVLVMPFLPYNRQERKAKTREPISAKLVANALVSAAGATQIVTLDLHASATQGFVNIPFQHITAVQLISNAIQSGMKEKQKMSILPASPDVGRAKVARKLGRMILGVKSDFAVVDKERLQSGESRVAAVVGNVKGKDVVLFDDMIDSAGTIINASRALLEAGASRIVAATIHPVFSDTTVLLRDEKNKSSKEAFEEYRNLVRFLRKNNMNAAEFIKIEKDDKGNQASFTVNALLRLQANPRISGIIFTDSIMVPEKNIIDRRKVRVVSVNSLIAKVCTKILQGKQLENYQHEG